MKIQTPWIIMFEDPDTGNVICHLHPKERDTYESYGLLVCDLVRHVAKCFEVNEEDVWEWVEKERSKPTTDIKGTRQKLN